MAAQEFSQYRDELSALAARGLAAAGASPANPGGTAALAIPAALLLLADEPPQYDGLAQGLHVLASSRMGLRVTDQAGHHRAVYDPLVIHLFLAAFARRYESLPAAVWSVCQSAVDGAAMPARAVEDFAGTVPPPQETALALWRALCLAEAAGLESRDVDLEMVDALVHRIAELRGPGGSLHPRGDEESLDAWTYRELAGLHALANLALVRRNSGWAKRVEEIARYHLENTQPDHTTTQPWGLFAFFWPDATRSMARQQVHDLTSQGAGVPGLVASLLLADAVDALGRFAG